MVSTQSFLDKAREWSKPWKSLSEPEPEPGLGLERDHSFTPLFSSILGLKSIQFHPTSSCSTSTFLLFLILFLNPSLRTFWPLQLFHNQVRFLKLSFCIYVCNVPTTIYLLIGRIYKGELYTFPGIYFPSAFGDFFDEISSQAKARDEISWTKSRKHEVNIYFYPI